MRNHTRQPPTRKQDGRLPSLGIGNVRECVFSPAVAACTPRERVHLSAICAPIVYKYSVKVSCCAPAAAPPPVTTVNVYRRLKASLVLFKMYVTNSRGGDRELLSIREHDGVAVSRPPPQSTVLTGSTV